MSAFVQAVTAAWPWKMAYRDSRAARGKLCIFSLSIVFGVAALVAIGSLRQNLNDAVNSQAKSLLGADMQLSGRQELSAGANQILAEIGGEQASEISFTTMLAIGSNKTPSLVNVRGVESGFPFYGNVATNPPESWARSQAGAGVIVEQSFLLRQGAEIGDSIVLGDIELKVIGTLDQAPPGSSGFGGISPTMITSLDNVRSSNLLSGKSLSFHRTHIKLSEGRDATEILKQHRVAIQTERLRGISAKQRSENIEQAVNNLYLFLNLIGFSALFLGGIGIAAALHVHIGERLRSVATLRCIGCSTSKSFAIYLIQGGCMGFLGTVLGLGIGCLILIGLAQVLASSPQWIPFSIEVGPVLSEILKAGLVGFSICICFVLMPLLKVRNISPLRALRDETEGYEKTGRDPLYWSVVGVLVVVAFLLAYYDNQELGSGVKIAAGYIVFLGLAFSLLLASGYLLRWMLRKLIRPEWPMALRQGFSALYRPNNQTSTFMVSIGLGVFFLYTLLLVQSVLLQWVSPDRMEERANLFMVDVPQEEIKTAKQVVSNSGAESMGEAPIIQLRLTKVKGKSVRELIASQAISEQGEAGENEGEIRGWILRRSFRSTIRKKLSDSETIVAGEWVGSYEEDGGPIPVSIEQRIAEDIGVDLGDTLTMEAEGFGEQFKLKVASLREVDWRSMGLNFFILLPDGPIRDYVGFNILTANSPGPKATAKLQQEMFSALPMVNVIDLSLVLKTVETILKSCGQVIQGMALFTVMTGALVLVSSILSGRRVRMREAALLRTLGATRGQISRILAAEYVLLALLSTVSGSLLASLATLLLGEVVLDGDGYYFPWAILLWGSLIVVLVTVGLGMALSIGVTRVPPLIAVRRSQ